MSPSPPPRCLLCFLSCKLLNFKNSKPTPPPVNTSSCRQRPWESTPFAPPPCSRTLPGCFTVVAQPLTLLPSCSLPRPCQLCPANDHMTCLAEGGASHLAEALVPSLAPHLSSTYSCFHPPPHVLPPPDAFTIPPCLPPFFPFSPPLVRPSISVALNWASSTILDCQWPLLLSTDQIELLNLALTDSQLCLPSVSQAFTSQATPPLSQAAIFLSSYY